jgi:hypothetical protein
MLWKSLAVKLKTKLSDTGDVCFLQFSLREKTGTEQEEEEKGNLRTKVPILLYFYYMSAQKNIFPGICFVICYVCKDLGLS